MIDVSAFNPRSTRLTLNRLRVNRPADTSSAIDSAICAVASDVRKRAADRAPDGWPLCPFERRDQIRPRAVQRRKQSEQQTRADGQRRGEQHDDRVDRQVHRVRRLSRQERGHQVQRPLGDDEAAEAAEDREETRLAEQLPHELSASRANRQPDRHLARARGAARQQQVRDVRARNQQHERGDAHQQRERRPRFRRHVALAAAPGVKHDRLRLEPRQRLRAHALLQRRFDVVDDRVVRRRERGAGLLDRDPGLQPARTDTPSRLRRLSSPVNPCREAAHA